MGLICDNVIFEFEEVNKFNVENLYELENKYTHNNVSKKDFIKNINFCDYESYLMIKSKETQKYYGFFNLLDINLIDDYAYIKFSFIKPFEDICYDLIYAYVDYLFNRYPIRKIYYELFLYEIDIAKHLKNIGFKVEVKYKNYKHYNNEYYSKYVLVLNRKDFYNYE